MRQWDPSHWHVAWRDGAAPGPLLAQTLDVDGDVAATPQAAAPLEDTLARCSRGGDLALGGRLGRPGRPTQGGAQRGSVGPLDGSRGAAAGRVQLVGQICAPSPIAFSLVQQLLVPLVLTSVGGRTSLASPSPPPADSRRLGLESTLVFPSDLSCRCGACTLGSWQIGSMP